MIYAYRISNKKFAIDLDIPSFSGNITNIFLAVTSVKGIKHASHYWVDWDLWSIFLKIYIKNVHLNNFVLMFNIN